MKASLTNETTGALFHRPVAVVEEAARTRAHEGLTVTPWRDGLPIWRAALNQLAGAGFYRCESWIEAIREAYSLNLEVATLHRYGLLRAAAVFARSKRLFSTRLVSMPFSDCAAPLALDDESRAELMGAVVAANPDASIEVRGVAGVAPWHNVDCFAQWSLDTARPFAEIEEGFGRTVRNGIKRAVRDKIQIECGADASCLARFYALQLVTRRRLGVPPQPLKFFETVREKFSRSGDIEIWFATLNGQDQAGLIMLRSGDQLCNKWAARAEQCHPGANHYLVAKMIEAHAGRAGSIDFGRCDVRNQGLVRSKADLGCFSSPAPYAFYPSAPSHISSEVLSGPARLVSSLWKRLPIPVTRVLGDALYRYMA